MNTEPHARKMDTEKQKTKNETTRERKKPGKKQECLRHPLQDIFMCAGLLESDWPAVNYIEQKEQGTSKRT